ncbi:nuclear pore complex protein NUP133 isoform X1 [Prunus dulcis]|uniref:nuclear pore complex protein NUP133 isoform X1 n=1 Tax=Prunus dulcis TaxID=3755 RepID=UPI001482C058|nr:nuclear pore complex protein NUP133 isoform X1 [Prunus dulcis]
MFSPGTKRSNVNPRRDPGSPATPLVENRRSVSDNPVPNRPSTGTPAPWAPRLSVLARVLPANQSEKGDEIKPVYVGEFPQVVRDEQASMVQKHVHGDTYVSGGMERGTSLAWIICGNRLFVWSYLSPAASINCIVLEIPANVFEGGDVGRSGGNCWLLCVVNWDSTSTRTKKVVKHCSSAGIVLCNKKTRAAVYWPDIYAEGRTAPVVSVASYDELEANSLPIDRKTTPKRQQLNMRHRSSLTGFCTFNSLIASAVPDSQNMCVALACSSDGELWQFHCSPSGVSRKKVYRDNQTLSSQGGDNGQNLGSKGYPRSLTWCFPSLPMQESNRQFVLLTDHHIQCFNVELCAEFVVSKLWSHEIIGSDGDLGIKKDLAGQKQIWPLDMQVDYHGKVTTILVATFCVDRGSGSSYTQYSLLTMQYKSGMSVEPTHERVLEKKAPVQVIIPKARVENEDFLFSMRLRVGGKPSGSAIILSGDGTATVSHYFRNSTRLYKFDLPYDAGKVLDASILPSTDDGEEGAWVVLTEKAGIWAIPEKAVILGGVEPPERSLSRKGSSNEGSAQEERKNLTFAGNFAPRRASSEAWDAGDRQRATTVSARQTAQDEESETLLSQLFHDYLLSGQVDASFEKLKKSGAFDRDRETNVFARMSRSIVDTLAKHWTTTRGAEILAMAVVSSQLMDKQQKHTKFLQFLALSKCHEELCSRQRNSLQIILEHGEKLAGMIQLRELQNIISQNRSSGLNSSHCSPENQISGALWDLIQLVGERARRNTVLLMDRDNAEVFYSKVSDLEQVFSCLDKQLEYVINAEQPFGIQVQRACELSNACVTIVRTAMQYRSEHHLWYPPPECLTPWYCLAVVRNGMWHLASLMLQLLKASQLDVSAKSDLYTHLEVLAEVLLETYAGAVTAKIELGDEHKGLLDEYWNRRDALLDSLYQQIKEFVEVGHQQNLNEGTDDLNEEILAKLSSCLLPMAKRHECYSTLWKICCDLNDSGLLRNLMHDSRGPNGGFSYFVFKQLYLRRQLSKLLRLGEEFPEELSIFLKYHQDLLWLHEVFLHQFSSASETLHELALSQKESSISEAEEGTGPEIQTMLPKLADRKRFLNLSKIAAIAGKDVDSETKVKRIEADLRILKLQEEIINLLPDDETKQSLDTKLLHPEDLIKLCLEGEKGAELSLRAFDVFAWTSSSFRKTRANLLEECWRNAADQDDWSKLYQASVSEGWSDEETLQNLKDTVLFQASNRCYGPEAETFGEGFDEVLSLRQEIAEPPIMKDSVSSVEAVLMQHKDYSEAGKLMLTAIMLGSLQDDNIEQEGPVPME